MRNEVCFIEDACRWWHQEEELCTSKISRLVEKLCLTVMLVRKLLCWWWWWIVSLLSERNEVWVIEDAFWWWHQEEKLCTSKISSLVEKLCLTVMLVRKTAVLMMMNGFVLVREILIEDYQGPALIWLQGCPDDDIKKRNSIHRFVRKLCFTVMLVRKLLYWWLWIVPWMREKWSCFIEDVQRAALMWHQDQKRHTWTASPGLPLMTTSKR